MKINLQLLREKTNNINKLIEDYEELNLNYYNKIKEIEHYWNNQKAKQLLSTIEEEKKEVTKEINNLKEISTIYDFIYNKYNNIGKNISVNIDEKEKMLAKVNKCIEKIKYVMTLYKNIDTTNYKIEQITIINSHNKKLAEQLKKMNDIKEKLNKSIKDIEEIETSIKNKISRINIEIIKETDISNMIE